MARPRLLAAFVMVLWALCYPLISLGLEDSPHLTFATMRGLLAGVTLLTIARLTGARLPRSAAEWGWITLAGLGMTGLGYFGFHEWFYVAGWNRFCCEFSRLINEAVCRQSSING